MEKNAFKKLEELALPFPKTFRLEELIKEASPNKLYFLRYQHDADLPKYVSSEYLSKQANFFRQLVVENKISQIAETIVTSIGGCVVTRGAERYIELVSGHVSGLLLYGWCYARAYSSNGAKTIVLTPQTQMVEQLPNIKRIAQAATINSDSLNYLFDSCKALLRKLDSGYLLEFIISSERQIYFVDIKDYDWQIDFAALVAEGKKGCTLYNHSSERDILVDIYDGDFNLNNLADLSQSTAIRLADRALLSHFITYSLNKGIAGIIK